MELSVLDSTFRRERLVENWNSLVWTERFSKNGDFQLVSNNISEIISLLPIGGPSDPPTLVAIDGSKVPMVVETHTIETPKNSPPQITTVGRSFETVMDRRVTIKDVTSGTPRGTWTVTGATSAAAAAYAVAKWIIVDGNTSALDVIPEILLLNSVITVGDAEDYAIDAKDLYATMLDILALDKNGLRAELAPLTDQIAIIIYEGTDRTEEVVFDVALDQFDQAKYLLTNAGYKNVMITATTNGMEYSTLLGADPSGLLRQVGFQDLSSEITVPAGTDLTNLTINKGKIALADMLPTALFSGGVSEDIGQGYGDLYFLGDKVRLQGDYGLSQDARVAEFVRTEDASGVKAYPTFEAIGD